LLSAVVRGKDLEVAAQILARFGEEFVVGGAGALHRLGREIAQVVGGSRERVDVLGVGTGADRRPGLERSRDRLFRIHGVGGSACRPSEESPERPKQGAAGTDDPDDREHESDAQHALADPTETRHRGGTRPHSLVVREDGLGAPAAITRWRATVQLPHAAAIARGGAVRREPGDDRLPAPQRQQAPRSGFEEADLLDHEILGRRRQPDAHEWFTAGRCDQLDAIDRALGGSQLGEGNRTVHLYADALPSAPRRRSAAAPRRQPMAGKYFEELTVGQTFKHEISRTITEADNVFFSTLTLNPQPLHIDFHAAAKAEFGKPLVNSLLTLGIAVGVSVGETTLGTTVGNLGFDKIEFPKPVFHGDTIYAETEVVDKRESKSRPQWGIVTFEHRARNQHGDLVMRARRNAMMRKKSAS
jgi:acyl dehydratase